MAIQIKGLNGNYDSKDQLFMFGTDHDQSETLICHHHSSLTPPIFLQITKSAAGIAADFV